MTTAPNLTSLARARAWAGVTSTNDDTLITSLISEVSQFIHNYLGRPSITSREYTEISDGQDNVAMLLRHWPVTGIKQVSVDGANVASYVLEPWHGAPAGFQQKLSLRGFTFNRGESNISITYDAGYKVLAELRSIPASGAYTVVPDAPYGSFAEGHSVTFANGAALTKVQSAPAAGQYTLSSGTYTFAASDAGAQVLLSYSFIPADIEHACVALVAERYRYRSRIGEVSKSLGGQESMSYSQKDMPEFIKTLLQPYRRMLPL